MKLSPKLLHTLLLSQVNLRWNEKQQAWYSVGQLGLAGVGKQPLNALIDGYVEISRENATDVVEIYLEPEPQMWYYFKYANNLLLAKVAERNLRRRNRRQGQGRLQHGHQLRRVPGRFFRRGRFRAHFQKDYLGKTASWPPGPPPGHRPDREARR